MRDLKARGHTVVGIDSSQTLPEYARTAGLAIERIREPGAPAQLVERDPEIVRWNRVPMFMWMQAFKPA